MSTVLFGAVLGGCAEEDDGWVETRHARIKGEFGVCAGLGVYVDERIELTAEWMELDPGPRIDLYFGPTYVEDRDVSFDFRIGGITSRIDGEVAVYSTGQALGHELVHAVRYSNDLVLPTLIDEGVARLYDGGEFRGAGGISYAIPDGATLPDDPRDAEIGVAATFIGWLHETMPRDAFLSLINDPGLSRENEPAVNWARIEQATGMSKAVLEQRWSADARDYYSEVSGCQPERQHTLAAGDVLRIDDEIACDDSPTTFGPFLHINQNVYMSQRWHCVSLDESRSVRVTVDGPTGSEFSMDVIEGSCRTTSPHDESADAKHIPVGTSAEFVLGDCEWATLVRSDPETVGSFTITFEALD